MELNARFEKYKRSQSRMDKQRQRMGGSRKIIARTNNYAYR